MPLCRETPNGGLGPPCLRYVQEVGAVDAHNRLIPGLLKQLPKSTRQTLHAILSELRVYDVLHCFSAVEASFRVHSEAPIWHEPIITTVSYETMIPD